MSSFVPPEQVCDLAQLSDCCSPDQTDYVLVVGEQGEDLVCCSECLDLVCHADRLDPVVLDQLSRLY